MPAVASHSTTMIVPMVDQMAVSSGVAMLKWLARPRTTWVTIAAISIPPVTATTVPPRRAQSRTPGALTREIIQASVAAYRTKLTENLNGLTHIG